MGVKDIIKIVEDAFLGYEKPYYENEVLCKKVGKAVLQVISEMRRIQTNKTYASVLNHSNAVQFIDQVEESDQRVYIWKGNTLRNIQDLDDQDLALVAEILENVRASRD
ncbi:MAG: hypothetical protein R6U96_19015 [Promethearchaeia archaeon]